MQHSFSTKDLIALDRAHLWHPFTPMKPWCENKDILVIEKGDREFLIDTEGRRYIDGVSSLWCNVHGHNIPELNQAVTTQLQKIAHSTLLGLANVPSILLAKRLIDLVQSRGLHFTKVFYSDNGSTAVEVAAKMAYQYWQNLSAKSGPAKSGTAALGCDAPKEHARSRFIAFANAYHGDTLGAVSLGGIPLFHQAFKSLCFPVDFVPPPSHNPQEIARSLAAIDSLLTKNADAYAALIIEPLVLGAGGMLMYPPEVLTQLRRLATKHNTLLIADEVLTGFGRTGKMFAWEHALVPRPSGSGESLVPRPSGSAPTPPIENQKSKIENSLAPDLLCLSKGLTAGYMPLGVTLATQKIFDAFYVDPNIPENLTKTFFHGHTYTGHPLACAVAQASLDLFEKNEVLQHVQSLMPVLAETLEKARHDPHVKNPRQIGLIAAFDLVDPDTKQSFPYHWRIAAALCHRLRSHGILLRPLADTLVLMPPLAITPENLRSLCSAVLHSLPWIPEIVAERRREFPL